MRSRLRRFRFPCSVSITIAVGLVTLIGLALGEGGAGLADIANLFVLIAFVTAAFAVMVGVVNLLVVHLRRLSGTESGKFYSLLVVLSLLVVVIARVIELVQADADPPALGNGPVTGPLFTVLQLSIESALAGLLAFFLIFGASRMLRRRVSAGAVLFIAVVLIVLLGWQPLPLVGDLAGGLRDWVVGVPAAGGLRGILIGMALGALIVGVRILLGRDQPYRG